MEHVGECKEYLILLVYIKESRIQKGFIQVPNVLLHDAHLSNVQESRRKCQLPTLVTFQFLHILVQVSSHDTSTEYCFQSYASKDASANVQGRGTWIFMECLCLCVCWCARAHPCLRSLFSCLRLWMAQPDHFTQKQVLPDENKVHLINACQPYHLVSSSPYPLDIYHIYIHTYIINHNYTYNIFI